MEWLGCVCGLIEGFQVSNWSCSWSFQVLSETKGRILGEIAYCIWAASPVYLRDSGEYSFYLYNYLVNFWVGSRILKMGGEGEDPGGGGGAAAGIPPPPSTYPNLLLAGNRPLFQCYFSGWAICVRKMIFIFKYVLWPIEWQFKTGRIRVMT